MGKILTRLALEKNNTIYGITPDAVNLKKDFPVFDDIYKFNGQADVVIDFSTASAVPKLIDYCLYKKIPAVICTTGLSKETENKILDAAKIIPIMKSANMSFGINILNLILEKISKVFFDNDFDIEIIEKHHNKKTDAPSGTALSLADTIKNSLDQDIDYVFDRNNKNNKENRKREKNEIGISCVRGGTIVGEHSIIFAGQDESIEIKHIAQSREIFALGALKAAEFILNKKPGLYCIKDMFNDLIK